jgi:hypothetical protein
VTCATICAPVFLVSTEAVSAQPRIGAETGASPLLEVSVDSRSILAPGQPAALVRQVAADRSESKKLIAKLEGQLDLNQRRIGAALNILGEKDVPPERLAAELVEIAEQFKDLQASALTQPGDDPKIAALKADAQKASDAC